MEKSGKSLTSANAATERLASAKRDREDLPCTQDLTQGTQDVDDGNVRRIQDPCMSIEASAKGTSTKCSETTPVVLKSAPHEMQKLLQDSLQVTQRRLPTEGKSCMCKQEVVESIVMAGHMNGMAEMAKPNVMDVDRKAVLGRDLAERVHIVNKGDRTECEGKLQPQQTKFYCKEKHQHNRNMNGDVPIANGLLLEGEWTVYASSEMGDPNLTLEGCERGMNDGVSADEAGVVIQAAAECCQQLCMADGDTDHEAKPMDPLNKS